MGIVIDSQLRSMKQWIVAAVVACVFAAAWAADFSDEEEGPGAQEKLLVAVKSTTTVWSVSVTSTTIPQICVNSYSTLTNTATTLTLDYLCSTTSINSIYPSC